MSKSVFAASVIALSVAVAPACATKKFVRTEVGNVNSKVDTVSSTVEQTQQRVGQAETRIGQVDQKAEAAGKSAAAANTAAANAQTAADAANASAKQVGTRVDQVATEVAQSRRLIYTVTLSEDQGNFDFGKAELPDAAKMRLDQMIDQLKTNPQNVFIEIEGHTDNVGSVDLNERLGMERAEAVKRYLYEQHQVPLHKINVISYGEAKPVAPNNTRAGRAQNRRVVVKVLS
jgi:outer membrane protein OmpA-like peptidoglycan-associated protein